MTCHVLGHVQPCKASFCAEIEREHQAVRSDEDLKVATWLRQQAEEAADRDEPPPTLWHVAALIAQGRHRASPFTGKDT